MKNGTLYAGRLKRAYARQRQSVAKPEIPEPVDALTCLAMAILAEDATETEARRAVDRILDVMVDWNEVRVSDSTEVNRAAGNALRNGAERCERIITALQSVFDRENRLSLDRLRSIGRREARQFLDKLDGVSDYVVASVLLWSLGGHAIPVNDRLLAALREADLVHPAATRAEVQAFLERHISAADAKNFCAVMRTFSPTKYAASRKRSARKKAKTG